ncbi:LigA [Achromobacter xylosoxidans NH44784-1996]|nr:LigA [Achromobacter xylosoxidans NH44784-1996]
MVGRPRVPERAGNPVHRRQPVRRQPAVDRRAGHVGRHPHRPAQHPLAHRGVLLQGRQHHAAAAGAGLDSRPVPGRRRGAGARPDHRLRRARKHRPPGHLRVRQRGAQGTPGIHLQHRHDRCAAAGHLPGRDRRQDAGHAQRRPGLRQLRAVVRAAPHGRRARHRRTQGRRRPALCRRGPHLRHQSGHVPQLRAALGARPGDAAIGRMEPAPASAASALRTGVRPQPADRAHRPGGRAGARTSPARVARQPVPAGPGNVLQAGRDQPEHLPGTARFGRRAHLHERLRLAAGAGPGRAGRQGWPAAPPPRRVARTPPLHGRTRRRTALAAAGRRPARGRHPHAAVRGRRRGRPGRTQLRADPQDAGRGRQRHDAAGIQGHHPRPGHDDAARFRGRAADHAEAAGRLVARRHPRGAGGDETRARGGPAPESGGA